VLIIWLYRQVFEHASQGTSGLRRESRQLFRAFVGAWPVLRGLEFFVFKRVAAAESGGPANRKYSFGTNGAPEHVRREVNPVGVRNSVPIDRAGGNPYSSTFLGWRFQTSPKS
jgi:hypothetical protein